MNTWILVCDCNHFDLKNAFISLNSITWPQTIDCAVGDQVYLYVTNPYRTILYSATVEEKNIYQMDREAIKFVSNPLFYENSQTYMRLKKLYVYPPNLLTDEVLKNIGLSNLQSSFKLSQNMADIMAEKCGRVEEYNMVFTPSEASNGCNKNIVLKSGKEISVNCPAGIREGQSIRLRVNGNLVYIRVSILSEVVKPKEDSAIVVHSKLGRGIIGAVIGGLLSSIVWIIFYKVGIISGIAGLASAVLVFKGYELLGKALDKKGIIASGIILAVVIYISVLLGVSVVMAPTVGNIIPIFARLNSMLFQGTRRVVGSIMQDLILAYAFSIIGSFAFINYVVKNKMVK